MRASLLSVGLLVLTTSLSGDRPIATQVIHYRFAYTVVKGDTLSRLASRFGVDASTIALQNQRRATTALSPGTVLSVDASHIVPADASMPLAIVVNIPQRHVFVVTENGTAADYPLAIGRPTWPTPTGDFTVIEKETHPAWDVPVSIQEELRREGKPVVKRVGPGPGNPLGEFWIGLSLPGIGIHGTNAPGSIYRATTHGCIRLSRDDIAAVFDAVSVGMRGRIVYAPTLIASVGGHLYVEVHPDIYQLDSSAMDVIRATVSAHGLSEDVDWTAVTAAAKAHAGIAVDVTAVVVPAAGAARPGRGTR